MASADQRYQRNSLVSRIFKMQYRPATIKKVAGTQKRPTCDSWICKKSAANKTAERTAGRQSEKTFLLRRYNKYIVQVPNRAETIRLTIRKYSLLRITNSRKPAMPENFPKITPNAPKTPKIGARM